MHGTKIFHLNYSGFQVNGYNQKLHLLVEVFSKCLKTLADDITEQQFNVFVQQLYQVYENIFLKPKALSRELRLTVIEARHKPLYEKNQRLRSISFSAFQQFCRCYCSKIKITAIMQGNILQEQALNIMQNVLNELDCGKIEDVCGIYIYVFFLTNSLLTFRIYLNLINSFEFQFSAVCNRIENHETTNWFELSTMQIISSKR